MNQELSASEALYGFTGWLTSRSEKVTASANDDAAVWAELVDKFCQANNLAAPGEAWPDNMRHPPPS